MKKVFIFFMLVGVSFVFFELFLRFSPFTLGVSPVEYDQDIGMWHKKNFSNYIVKECYKTKFSFDQYGRMQNNYPYSNEKKDIILIGDSQIEALMVDNASIMHNSLYRHLGHQFNVLNYALSGTGPSQHLRIMQTKVDLHNIHHLIHFVFLENDLNDGDPASFDGTNRPKVYMQFEDLSKSHIIPPRPYDTKEKVRDFIAQFELYIYLKKTFYYYQSLWRNTPSIIIDAQDEAPQFQNLDYKWKQLQGSIYQMNQLAVQHKFRYTVIFISTLDEQGNIKLRQQLEDFLHQENIQGINLLPFIEQLQVTDGAKIDFECDGHWNGQTHTKIARYLYRTLFDGK